MTTLSKSAFALSRGWAKSYISKLAKNGRLVLTAQGLVDVEATDRLLTGTSDPSKASVAARHERERTQRDVQGQAPPALVERSHLMPATRQMMDSGEEVPEFQESRAYREYYESRLTESEFHKVQGTHVEMEAVKAAAYTAGRMVRDLLLGMPPQLAPELAPMTDPWAIEKHLTAAIRRTLEDAERMSSADLVHAVTTPS